MKLLQRFYPHILAFIGFVLVSIVYFYPVLQNKVLYQSDIAQYTGMAKEQNDFREKTGEEPYWTNSAFGGMPTYQLGANYPHNYIKKLDGVIRFLPRPADYLFLYFAGFYVLALVLRADPLKAFFGALSFGFSTYLVIILGVGHNAKAHAIAYMPLVVAGVILVFRKRYVVGGLLTLFATALEINANHFQMTYYLLLLLIILGGYYAFTFVKNKEFKELGKVAGTFAIAVLLAVGANAANLMATSEYTDFSMRGKSELTLGPDGKPVDRSASMSREYITEYSYGIAESLNLVAARLMGGGHGESLGEDSEVYQFWASKNLSPEEVAYYTEVTGRTYWGDQPIVEAPAYIGALVFFLAVLAFFADKKRLKYVFLVGAIVSLLLSWGKNLPGLTDFFIDHIPLYDKFRAVSSIQVILELCFPALAVIGLTAFFKMEESQRFKALWRSAAVVAGLFLLLLVFKGSFDFTSPNDQPITEQLTQMGGANLAYDFNTALQADREAMYTSDVLRSLCFVLAAAVVLWLSIRKTVSQTVAIALVGILTVSDLFFVDKRYVDTADMREGDRKGFVSASRMKAPFDNTQADEEIAADDDIFRVHSLDGWLAGETSFYHKATGGYSAVRPRRYEELFNYHIHPYLYDIVPLIDTSTLSMKVKIPALNALNVRYLTMKAGNGQKIKIDNPFANGNAWFVQNVIAVHSADAEMKAMGRFDAKKDAVVNTSEFKVNTKPAVDSSATIVLDKASFRPNYAKYVSESKTGGIAVFSEVYYPKGWKVTLDGNDVTDKLFRADYVLRALEIPAGKHTVEFRFEPDVVETGGVIMLLSCIGILLVTAGGVYYLRKTAKETV